MKTVLTRLLTALGACLISAIAIWIFAAPVNGCVVRFFSGIPCPSCGMTRAAFSLLRFDFSTAFHYHPLVYLVLPLSLFVLIRYIFWGILPTDKRYVRLYIGTVVVFMAVWLVRLFFFNIP